MQLLRKFSLSRSIGLVLTLLLIGCLMCVSGGAIFISLPVYLITFGFTFLLLLATFGSDYLKFLPDSILTLFSTPSQPIPRYADIARYGSRYAIAGAVIATLSSFIQMLTGFDDPSSIGVGMATSLMPMFYALILSEIIFAILYKVYSEGTEPKDTPPLPATTLAVTMIILGILTAIFFAMLVSFGCLGCGWE